MLNRSHHNLTSIFHVTDEKQHLIHVYGHIVELIEVLTKWCLFLNIVLTLHYSNHVQTFGMIEWMSTTATKKVVPKTC